MAKLTARKVETASPGKYGDGDGLQLVVSPTGARKWVLRYSLDRKPREMGLGPYPEITLASAREKALAARRLLKSGTDPIAERKKVSAVPTFGEMADDVLASLLEGFRNTKHRDQWKMTLEVYAAPLRPLPVDAIETADVLAVLRPIWLTKPETASRVRGRIEKVLSAAKARGFRTGENPAAWRGHLDSLLPKRLKLTRGHHAAMPYAAVPSLVALLQGKQSMAARALTFTILTAARSGEVLGARWDEVDLDRRVWTVPASRMKAARVHTVPLSEPAVELVQELRKSGQPSEFVFWGRTSTRYLSGMAMTMELRRMGHGNVTVHGFRSGFRDWAGNETSFPRELAEHALAHLVGNVVEQSYRRDDALERRRALMDAWAQYCCPPDSNVIALARAGEVSRSR